MPTNIRFVLIETSHPGNIGAAARALKTMAFSELYLVSPELFPHAQATAMAAGAEDILENAHVVKTLDEAISDCVWVVGTSARTRAIAWPMATPREIAPKIKSLAKDQTVAVLFGPERTGLETSHLQRCHAHVQIPANPHYSALNLAAAVQILAYELFQVDFDSSALQPLPEGGYATDAEIQQFYDHLQESLIAIDFLDPENPKQLLPRLKRLFQRIHLESLEVKMLRGICTQILYHCRRRVT